MDKFEILKAKAKELGLSSEEIVRYFFGEKELSCKFLQNLLDSAELLKAEDGGIKVNMFYYAEDKTFSERLLPYKQVSGVVGDVDEAGQHGLISLLHYKVLPWTSDELFVGLPDGLSGKENTRLILEKAASQQQKAEAAAYCATYAFDGVKAGEAFLASYSEMSRICKNYLSINKSLRQINNADIFIVCRAYWTSSEKQAEKAMSASMPGIVSNDVIAKWAKLYVCPVIAF